MFAAMTDREQEILDVQTRNACMPAKHLQLVGRLVFSGITLSACAITPALGADLLPEVAGQVQQVDFADWSGASIGVQGSAGSSFGNFGFGSGAIGRRSLPSFRTGDATGRADPGRNATTALGGVFGGYSWQIGPYVFGVEADVYGANLKRPVSSTVAGFGFENADSTFSLIRAETGLFGTARARLGYAFER